ncbi:hypothetical protein [Agrobacterium radiobacter]|uniref:hypothetical protein n=1 Tax=Agrobacterium radiobacter TaxID=362 RepID=UPI003CE49E77
METRSQIRARAFVKVWTAFIVLAVYLPILCGALAGLSKGRYFSFPISRLFNRMVGQDLCLA